MRELSTADNRVLFALYRLHYLTPRQLCRLLYSYPSSIRYAEDNLKGLAEKGYLIRDAIPTKAGRSPVYYMLSHKGMTYLTQTTDAKRRYIGRLADEEGLFIRHSLNISDFMVHAVNFCKQFPDFTIARGHHERELREMNMEVKLPTGKKRTVTPDAWLDLQSPTRRRRFCIALELQRTMLEQKRWTPKIEGLILWSQTTMRPVFETREVTFAFVVPDEHGQRESESLVRKTEKALVQLQRPNWGKTFCFWGGELGDIPSVELFTKPVWKQPFEEEPVALLEGLES